jgi:hypothetical protein
MTKTFSKELADEIGYANATCIAAIASELVTDLVRSNATRKAQGLQTIEQEEAEMLDALIERLEAGELDGDPELKQEAIEAKAERDAKPGTTADGPKQG